MQNRPLKIVYCTPALYMAGGVERVLTLKANYFAEHFGYDITIVLTEGKDKPLFYPLSNKINIVNLDVNFEELWTCSFVKKVFVYLSKQRIFKKRLTAELMHIRPDITVSLLRREINFINDIKDGSKKIGELHVNRANYRNFEEGDANFIKNLFAKFWMRSLVSHLKQLDKFIVLTEEDKASWTELSNVEVIPDPLAFDVAEVSPLKAKRVIAVGRYVYQKGFDLLLEAWCIVYRNHPDWQLCIYGGGDNESFQKLSDKLGLSSVVRCNPAVTDISAIYAKASFLVFSSRYEGFGLVLLEAMAVGLPVVSFDSPCGPKDIVKDGVNGLLAESGNVNQLAEKICYMIEHDEDRHRMAENTIRTVELFKKDAVMQKWIQLFNSL